MKYLTAMTLALSLCLPATAARADGVWTRYRAIQGVTVVDTYLEVWFTNTSSDANNIFRVYTRDPNYKVKSSLAMSAFFSGHQLKVKYDNSGTRPAKAYKLRVRR